MPISTQKKPTAHETRFRKLVKQWRGATEFLSKSPQRAMHPAYQKIIGMGDAAVPLILRDLERNGSDDWFWALTAITDENPINDEIAGDMQAMAEAWLQWGRNAGYLIVSRKKHRGSFQN